MMNKGEYKRSLFNKTFRQVLWVYFVEGLKSLIHSITKISAVFMLASLFLYVWWRKGLYFERNAILPRIQNLLLSSFHVVIIILFLLVLCIMLVLFGMPRCAKRYHDNFQRAGMINSATEAPALLKRTYDEGNSRIQKLVFFCKGLPLSQWQDNKEKIESALNISIDRIERGKNNQHIVVYCVDGNYQLPDRIDWSNSYLSDKGGFTLVLGESIASRVEVDLSKTPHVLLGGSTGSGKTLLLKLILMQCALKGAEIYVADFKGGVDFNKSWKSHAQIITEQENLEKCLDDLVDELHRRKKVLAEKDCANIDEYNRKFNSKMHRQIFACDEVAELLDSTGLCKKDKERIQQYTAMLSTLIRLGRAMGIHCILATQRPDAQVISGQIKNNIDFRVCGRADDVLSQIVLDKTDANDLISKTAQGRFLSNTDVLLQAYFFDDKKDW